MKSIDKLKLFGNAMTSSAFNPYTATHTNWSSVWNACRASLLLQSSTPPELMEYMLTTPVCVSSQLSAVHAHNNVLWIGTDVLNAVHPDQLGVVVEDIYQRAQNGSFHTTAANILGDPVFDFWTKSVWSDDTIDQWKKWVRACCMGVSVGAWSTPTSTASRFRSCAVSSLAQTSTDLVRLQTGSNLLDVLHEYCSKDELTLEQTLVVKQLCEICLPPDTQEREEVVQQLAVQWAQTYDGGPEVDRMLALVTGTHARPLQRWKDNLDVHWLKICQNWSDFSYSPCSDSKVLEGLLSAYSPTMTGAIGEWIDLYLQAHADTNTPISDFCATHVTLTRSNLLPQAFSILTRQQQKVAEDACASGLFPDLQTAMDTMAPKNVVRLPTRRIF